MDNSTIINALEKHIKGYLYNMGTLTKKNSNKIDIKVIYPVEEKFKNFVFKTMKDMGLDVVMNDDIIYITLDGYKMPVIVHFNVGDNIYEDGSVEYGVWFNDYVKEPV